MNRRPYEPVETDRSVFGFHATKKDYTREAPDKRREFITERTGAKLEHVASYSLACMLPETSSISAASRSSNRSRRPGSHSP